MSESDAAVLALASRMRTLRERLSVRTQLVMGQLWRRLDPQNLTRSWDAGVGREMALTLATAQLRAASTSTEYITSALALQGVDAASDAGELVPGTLAGVASDGRPLASLLYQAVADTADDLAGGVPARQALTQGLSRLERMADTQVIDAARVGDSVVINSRPKVDWYVRMLSPPSCSRCAILAGRVYRSERAFPRHPRCDCIHVPVGDRRTGNRLTVSPREYFDGLSVAEQDRLFTKPGAQAIRDGADIYAVVNARRGMSVAGSFTTRRPGPELEGRNDLVVTHRGRVTSGLTTSEGMTRRGFAGRRTGPLGGAGRGVRARLMPEGIYQLASDRAEILRLLRQYGYLS